MAHLFEMASWERVTLSWAGWSSSLAFGQTRSQSGIGGQDVSHQSHRLTQVIGSFSLDASNTSRRAGPMLGSFGPRLILELIRTAPLWALGVASVLMGRRIPLIMLSWMMCIPSIHNPHTGFFEFGSLDHFPWPRWFHLARQMLS